MKKTHFALYFLVFLKCRYVKKFKCIRDDESQLYCLYSFDLKHSSNTNFGIYNR